MQSMHGVNPLKRPMPLAPAGRPMADMPPMKRPRMPAGQFVGGVSGTQPYNTAGEEHNQKYQFDGYLYTVQIYSDFPATGSL